MTNHPTILGTIFSDHDPPKSQRIMQAMLQMEKLDFAKLQKAYNNN